jgi:hypothetical protein
LLALEGSDPEDVGGVAGVAQDTQKPWSSSTRKVKL